MGRRASQPIERASKAKERVESVRRRYKQDVSLGKRMTPAESRYRMDSVIVLYLAGYTQVQIAQTIGVSRLQVRKFLAQPEVEERIVALRASLPKAALELMHGYMIEAVQTIVDVMRSSGSDDYRLKAAQEILDRGGIPKASRQERHQTVEETVHVQTDVDMEALRALPPDKQEEFAQMMEGVEKFLATYGKPGGSGPSA